MPKSDLQLDGGDYARVADRITLFYARHPEGRIVTELVSRAGGQVIFRAAVFRSPADREPAATGWASEREGDGDVNAVACLENTETSAIGRALANLGFTASARRPSAEEMAKASRARARLARPASRAGAATTAVVGSVPAAPGAEADEHLRHDVLALLRSAEREGLHPVRAARVRQLLAAGGTTRAELAQVESGLRAWLARRAPSPASGGADGTSTGSDAGAPADR